MARIFGVIVKLGTIVVDCLVIPPFQKKLGHTEAGLSCSTVSHLLYLKKWADFEMTLQVFLSFQFFYLKQKFRFMFISAQNASS